MIGDQAQASGAAPAKKTAKPKTAATHPKYIDMISAAVRALNERGGSSRQAITKWIIANYSISENVASTHIKQALKRGVASNALIHTKGLGASGSFKLVKKVEKPKKKKVVKKKPVKKPKKPKSKAKKTTSPKKSAKKTAGKKDKKSTKKTATKKPTKKPAAKKTAAKKDKGAKKAKTTKSAKTKKPTKKA